MAAQDAFAAVLNRSPAAGPAEGISPGIHGIGEEVVHRCVDRKLPQRSPLPWMLVVDVGERDPVGPQQQEDLADALHALLPERHQ